MLVNNMFVVNFINRYLSLKYAELLPFPVKNFLNLFVYSTVVKFVNNCI